MQPVNNKSYEGAYMISSSKKSIIDETIAIRPKTLDGVMRWGNTEREDFRKYTKIDDSNPENIHVYLPNDEVLTLSKLTAKVFNEHFSGWDGPEFNSDAEVQKFYLENF